MPKPTPQATPGPWRIGETRNATVYDTEGTPVADCYMARDGQEITANARLIAAAPQMRDALEAVLSRDAHGFAEAPLGSRLEAIVRAALRAAGGEG